MPGTDLDELLGVAITAARDAGGLLAVSIGAQRTHVGTKTTGTDMVTEMDQAAERRIADLLHRQRPGDAIVGEEGADRAGTTGVRWIVDPLDGTTNYLYGIPAYAVSVAAEVDGEVAVGVVFDPSHGELYTATRSGGAMLNGRPLRVEGAASLAVALAGTGFSYTPARRVWQAAVAAGVIGGVRDIRRFGAAALDLCWVAGGRLDLFWERSLNAWDYAAGALIAAEAGAWVGDLAGGADLATICIAAPPHLAGPFRQLLAEAEDGAGPLPPISAGP